MQLKSKLLTLILTLCMLVPLVLTSCGEAAGLKSAYVDEKGNLIAVLADGSEQDLGQVSKLENKQKGTTGETTAETEKPSHTGDKPTVSVNEEFHAILTYPDGTTEDIGYVGVEVEPPMYTVTFVDANGKTLKSETLYRGKDATAPTAPEVEDKTFDKWDVDYTNVQSDLTVKATYKDKATYKVTFLDASGKTIKTEDVVEGKSATAPNAPAVDGKVFDHWDKDFTNVKSELTVTAIYREKGSYVVSFKDYSGRDLGSASVAEGGTAVAPVTPSREGYTFLGWSSPISGVTSNKTVTALYQLNAGSNIIDISYELTSASTVKVTYAVKGSVKFAGCDIEIVIPSNLTYQSMEAGNGVVANKSGNSILINVAGSTNLTSETKLAAVTYSFTGSDASFTVNVAEMFDQNMNNVSYSVIGKKIVLK